MWVHPFWLQVLFTIVEGCGDSGAEYLASSIALRIGDAAASFVPVVGGVFTAPFWIIFDAVAPEDEIECYVKKFIRDYHIDRVDSVLQLWYRKMKIDQKSPRKILQLLESFEDPSNLEKVHSKIRNTRAAIFPFILPWAAFHLGLYKGLLAQYPSKKVELKKKHKYYADFYTKKMLTYYRPYREKAVEEIPESEKYPNFKKHGISAAAYDFVTKTEVRNVLEIPGGSFYDLVQSCVIRSGDRVAFKIPGFSPLYDPKNPEWLSCWGDPGSYCTLQSCPGHHMTFDEDGTCSGEAYWIYADTDVIRRGTKVNVQYNNGYYLSTYYGTYRSYVATIKCPGEKFTGIKSRENWNCEKENLRISKRGYYDLLTKKLRYPTDVIAEGSFINLHPIQAEYEIFKKGTKSQPNACSIDEEE